MEILLIRHGESEADLLHVIEGRADFPLTEKGKEQAKRMAEWVGANYTVDIIYSSPLQRARQTAEYLAHEMNLSIRFDGDLMEWNNGLIAGLSRTEADERYPKPDIVHPHTSVYGQESLITFRSRLETMLSKIIHENNESSTIAVVSHGNAISQLFNAFIQSPVNQTIHLATGDTGIHHLRIAENMRSIQYTNKQVHLL